MILLPLLKSIGGGHIIQMHRIRDECRSRAKVHALNWRALLHSFQPKISGFQTTLDRDDSAVVKGCYPAHLHSYGITLLISHGYLPSSAVNLVLHGTKKFRVSWEQLQVVSCEQALRKTSEWDHPRVAVNPCP